MMTDAYDKFQEENKKLDSTEFEDLPLLVNEMETPASEINFKNKLRGEGKTAYHVPSGTLVKEAEEKDMEKASIVKTPRESNKDVPDPRLEAVFRGNVGAEVLPPKTPTYHPKGIKPDPRLEQLFSDTSNDEIDL